MQKSTFEIAEINNPCKRFVFMIVNYFQFLLKQYIDSSLKALNK